MALLAWENAVETAALSASAALEGFGPDMLRIPEGNASVAWQTPAGTISASLTITAPAAIAWRALCLARTNLTSGATLRVRAGAYDSGTVPAGVAWGVRQALHLLPAGLSGTVMQLDVADPANPDGFLNIPLAFAGPAYELIITPDTDEGLDIRRADAVTRGGGIRPQPLSHARGWQIAAASVPDAFSEWLARLQIAAAAARNVLFVPRPEHPRAAAEAVLGLLAPSRRGFITPVGDFRSWSATITERL